MLEASPTMAGPTRAAARAGGLFAAGFAACLCLAPRAAEAQSWSSGRSNPALWQIAAIDDSGQAAWPYGAEDVAGDGAGRFESDEAATDLRTVYADADASRLWLRAYVASASAPPNAVRAFFFLDTDGRSDRGGPVYGEEIDAALSRDLSRLGYERALGVSGSGDVLGAWQWNESMQAWTELALRPTDVVRGEAGTAVDPLGIGGATHGYLQVDALHAISMFSASCDGKLFVRLVHDASPARTFGDDVIDAFACRAPADVYGDPAVLRSSACRTNADCPAGGTCRSGLCLFTYGCTTLADCRSDEVCRAGVCVHQVDTSCSQSRQCDGLVCSAGRCVPCANSGAAACASDLYCAPNGNCLDPTQYEPGASADGGAGNTGDDAFAGKVQGGSLTCSAAHPAAPGARWVVWLLAAIGLAWPLRRVARRKRAGSERGAP